MKNCSCSFLSRLALPGLMSLILLSPAIMRADTISTFLVSGNAINLSGMTLDYCTNQDICPFSGMFQVETNDHFGTVESSGLNFVFPGLPTFNILGFSQPKDPNLWIFSVSNAFDYLEHYFFTATPDSLIGFTGGPIVGGDAVTNAEVHLYVGFIGSSTLVSEQLVPEPSSLVLLAGGIVLLLLGLTRRFRK